MQGGQVAGQNQANLVGIDFFTLIIDYAAAVAVAVKAQREIRARLAHGLGHGVQHDLVFWIGVVFWEGIVEIAIHLDHLYPHGAQGLGCKGPGCAITAGGYHLERAGDLKARGNIGNIALSHTADPGQFAAGAFNKGAVQDNVLKLAHFFGTKG